MQPPSFSGAIQKAAGWYLHQCEALVSAVVIRPAKRRAAKYDKLIEENPFGAFVTQASKGGRNIVVRVDLPPIDGRPRVTMRLKFKVKK